MLRRTGDGCKESPSGEWQIHPMAGRDDLTRRKDPRLRRKEKIPNSWVCSVSENRAQYAQTNEFVTVAYEAPGLFLLMLYLRACAMMKKERFRKFFLFRN